MLRNRDRCCTVCLEILTVLDRVIVVSNFYFRCCLINSEITGCNRTFGKCYRIVFRNMTRFVGTVYAECIVGVVGECYFGGVYIALTFPTFRLFKICIELIRYCTVYGNNSFNLCRVKVMLRDRNCRGTILIKILIAVCAVVIIFY